MPLKKGVLAGKKRIGYIYVEFLTLLKYYNNFICYQIVLGNDSWRIQLIKETMLQISLKED